MLDHPFTEGRRPGVCIYAVKSPQHSYYVPCGKMVALHIELRDDDLHIHDWGDSEYAAIKRGKAYCVDPGCPDKQSH